MTDMTDYERQKLVGAACVRVALAMIDYSNSGLANDMPLVSDYLTKAMYCMSSKFTPGNEERFEAWLIKKTNEAMEQL